MNAVVTLHVWRVASHRVPAALGSAALDPRRIRARGGVRFAKLFARFGVLSATGSLDGRDPLAGLR